MSAPYVEIRRASAEDAVGLAKVFEAVVSERIHSAIDRAWDVEEQRRYLESLSSRAAIYLAVSDKGEMIGCQTLEPYSTALSSMAHVGQLGTFLLPAWRRRRVGKALFIITSRFAVFVGYRKLVIHVRASNTAAQSFYKKLGFSECGRLKGQVIIDGVEDDEILMEMALTPRTLP